MMQLVCNGEILDLYENASLQFTQDNPLFAFDNIKCERTTQFKLPRTKTNDNVFMLSRLPETKGDGMRRKYPAQLRFSGLNKDGYLYVSSFDGKDYNAIFVTGELVGLQRIKNVGKIQDIISPTNTTLWGSPADANTARAEVWKCIKYLQEKSPMPVPIPSMRLKSIIEMCATALGVNITLPSGVNYTRIIPSKLKEYSSRSIIQSAKHTPANVIVNELLQYDRLFEPCTMALQIPVGDVYYWQDPEPPYSHQPEQRVNFNRKELIGTIKGLRAKVDLRMTFNADAAGFGIYTGASYAEKPDYDTYWAAAWASLDADVQSPASSPRCAYINGFVSRFETYDVLLPNPDYDDPSENEYIIPAGTEFTFLRTADIKAGFTYADIQAAAIGDSFRAFKLENNNVAYTTGGQPDYSLEVNVYTDTPEENAQVLLYPNLPDVSLVDLLKIVANLTGKLLCYSDRNGVTFEDLDLTTAPVDLSQKLLSKKELSRGFNKWAQNNIVTFTHDETMLQAEYMQRVYAIDNENLAQTNELSTMYASEGSMIGDALYMRNMQKDISKDTLCRANSTAAELLRVTLPKNTTLAQLCYMSTQFEVEVRMGMLEYNAIAPKTLLLINGTRYVWTASNWQKDVAKFTLAKI